jgi:hypothetical protein
MRYLRVAVLAALLALLSNAAFAQTAWDAMQAFGLTGTWSLNCQAPPGGSNFWMTYYLDANGVARRSLDRGDGGSKLMLAVDSAQVLTSTTLAASMRNDDPGWGASNGTVADLIIVKENGRVRTLDSKGSDGKQYVKDGVALLSGSPMPWLEKCGN